jgi:FdrA protein
LIKRSEYHDSVSLMLAARELSRYPGVSGAAVVMATEANKGLLKNAGLLTPEAAAAGPNDLVIAVGGPQEVLAGALDEAEKLLKKKQAGSTAGEYRPKTIGAAVKASPAANLAVISVAGRYAAAEAWEALYHGLHVLLFSDNVTLEDEIDLKQYAIEHGLLMMGPGAGTAILNGAALGFANVLPAGPVGIVSAAGTGLQEVSTLLAKRGVGVSQGIGTGGRDMKEQVGGLMMLAGLRALQEDPATAVIVLVSKPPGPQVAGRVFEQVRRSPKPTVVCFLGYGPASPQALEAGAKVARTLEEAASLAAQALAPGSASFLMADLPSFRAEELRLRLSPAQKYLRSLFSGGTLCYEAQVIWRDLLAEPVYSNAPLDEAKRLVDALQSRGHTAVDLGEEEFTVGRPHPMIDNDLRISRLMQEARDPETAVVMLDVVLGYGAHLDPASELASAARQAGQIAAEAGRSLALVASVTGSEGDPQGLACQVQALEGAGVIVCASNASAARFTASIVRPL